jgi:hypothetical protein
VLKNGTSGRDPALRGYGNCSHLGAESSKLSGWDLFLSAWSFELMLLQLTA